MFRLLGDLLVENLDQSSSSSGSTATQRLDTRMNMLRMFATLPGTSSAATAAASSIVAAATSAVTTAQTIETVTFHRQLYSQIAYTVFTSVNSTAVAVCELDRSACLKNPRICMGVREVAVALCLVLLILMTTVGNILIVLSVCIYRRMRTFTNVLLVSLASADLLVGVVIMGPAMIYMLLSGWAFGELLCKLWATLDVLLCTASILNLVVISLDRYCAITWPLKYIRRRTKKLASTLLLAVYLVSLVICSPPWFVPQWAMQTGSSSGSGSDQPQQLPECSYVRDLSYRIYSACGSFFVPLFVMLYVYYKILRVANTREQLLNIDRKGSKKVKMFRGGGAGAGGTGTSVRYTTQTSTNVANGGELNVAGNPGASPLVLPSTQVAGGRLSIDRTSCGNISRDFTFSENISTSCRTTTRLSALTMALPGVHFAPFLTPRSALFCESATDQFDLDESTVVRRPSADGNHCNDLSSEGSVGGGGGGRKISGGSDVPTLLQTAKKCHDRKLPTSLLSKANEYYMNSKPQRCSKEKMLYLRERKALKTIGVVVSGFVICWLPFFVCYVLESALDLRMPADLNFFFLWLGYSNSALNPLIYTFYNKDFRRCFRDILTCGCLRDAANRRQSVKLLRRVRINL